MMPHQLTGLVALIFAACAAAQNIPQTAIDARAAAPGSAKRAEFFNSAAPSGPELDASEPNAREHIVHFIHKAVMAELPGNLADTIVLGTIYEVQPYLTANRKGVFTEMTLNVETVFDHAGPLPDRTLTIAAFGGFLRLPNGWVADSQVEGMGKSLIKGGRYVLFLKYQPETACFRIVKGWEINGGKAMAMSADDLGGVRKHTSVYDGMSEHDFLVAVQQVRANPSGK